MGRARAGGAIALLLPIVLTAAPAYADTDASQSLVVDSSAWSWRRAVLPPGLPVDEPSQVPAGRLAVAFDGNPDPHPAKATYLHLDLASLPTSATVAELTLTLPVDTTAQSVDAGGIRLVACRLVADFRPGEGSDPTTMPAEDCRTPSAGKYDAAGAAWSFSLGGIAQDWVTSQNHGIVIRPALDYAAPVDAPFQLVFLGAAQLRADLAATVPAAPVPAPQPAPAPAPAVVDGPVLSVGAPPALTSVPPVLAPAPQVIAAPMVATATTTPVDGIRPAAQVAPLRTSTSALLALTGLIGLLLVAVGRAVGSTAPTLAYARAERRRLDRLRRPEPSMLGPLVLLRQEHSLQGRRPMSSAASTVT